MSVPAREADAYIRDGVNEAHTRFRARITHAPAAVDTAPLVEEVNRVTAKIEDLRAAYAADAIDLADMTALNAKLRRDRDAAQARLDAATIADARPRSAEALAAEWDGLDLAQRRAVLRGLDLCIVIRHGSGWSAAERITVGAADVDPAVEAVDALD